jgi:hypothetical protein
MGEGCCRNQKDGKQAEAKFVDLEAVVSKDTQDVRLLVASAGLWRRHRNVIAFAGVCQSVCCDR